MIYLLEDKLEDSFIKHFLHTLGRSVIEYVTFQVESGDRMELAVSGREYGMLAEGDIGKLTFQGTRYLAFKRE